MINLPKLINGPTLVFAARCGGAALGILIQLMLARSITSEEFLQMVDARDNVEITLVVTDDAGDHTGNIAPHKH